MLITISISRAPSAIASRASYAFTRAIVAPSGNPTTAHTPTPLPSRRRAASLTHVGLTQTLANVKSSASRHRISMSCRVASGLRRVWSISLATSPPVIHCFPSTQACASVIMSNFFMPAPPEILLSEDQIQKRVAELALELRRDFPEGLHLV